MDTRFWGPSGWKLIHLAATAYTPSNKAHMRRWLAALPYVLPCKFCRASLISYYEELSVEPALTSADKLLRWTYKIHGKVNDKLRGQGQTIKCDPPFSEVRNYYMSWLEDDTKCSRFPIWEFLLSVAYQHPRSTHGSTPMPDAPPEPPKHCSLKDKCRWNYITADERMPAFRTFWRELPHILPKSLQVRWLDALHSAPLAPALESRKKLVPWVWRIQKATDTECEQFPAVCRRLAAHSSDCHKSKRAKTCRKKRSGRTARKTRKN
jgi:hypothetical protein